MRRKTSFKVTPLARPVEPAFKPIYNPTPAQVEADRAQTAANIALRAQFEAEWVPPPGYSPEADDEEMLNISSAALTVWLERRKGRVAAASTPVWVTQLDHWLVDGPTLGNDGILTRHRTAVSLTLPFLVKGGGDMQLTAETYKEVNDDPAFGPPVWTRLRNKLPCLVRSEHGVFAGWLKQESGEQSWYVVSLAPKAPQEVADRIAATLDAFNALDLAQDYPAVMPVSGVCAICSRPLTDLVSKTLGIGPDCAAALRIAHSPTAADAVIAKRRALGWVCEAV